ncbi:MAG: hypothetical protein IPM01_11605 [Burkholderiaceae bacterium]|nr:hypothetical protein [Burkholderiaceae bacterium]
MARYAAQQARYAGLGDQFGLRELGLGDLMATWKPPAAPEARTGFACDPDSGLPVIAPGRPATPLLPDVRLVVTDHRKLPPGWPGQQARWRWPASPGPGGARRSMNHLRQYPQMASR